MIAPTIAWRPSLATGEPLGNRNRRRAAGACSCPLAFLPGEAFQFDWSEDWAVIAGERTKLQVAHFKIYSRAFILVPILSKPMRCCSMPLTTPSASWAACRGGASTTTCALPSTRSAATND